MRILSLLVALVLFLPCTACADYDFASMSVDELLAMRSAINTELLSRGFEKEVTVPNGNYTIGVDIPAGTYTIRPAISYDVVNVYDANGDYLANFCLDYDADVYIGKYTFEDQQVVNIVGAVIFAPYTGLGF